MQIAADGRASSLPLIAAARASAEDQVGFLHQSYVEDHKRMTVNTEAQAACSTTAEAPWLEVTVCGRLRRDRRSHADRRAGDRSAQDAQADHARADPQFIHHWIHALIDGVSGRVAGEWEPPISHSAIPLAESRDIRRGGDIAVQVQDLRPASSDAADQLQPGK